jgi:hypothetical protein
MGEVLIRRLDAGAAAEAVVQVLNGRAGEAPGFAVAQGGQAVAPDGAADGGGL